MINVVKKGLLALWVLLTVISIGAIVYANIPYPKRPINYGLLVVYEAEKWADDRTIPILPFNTLGITLGNRIDTSENEIYEVLIVDPEKALSWMKNDETFFTRYNGELYLIYPALNLTPGIHPPSIPVVQQLQIPLVLTVAIGWVFLGRDYYSSRRKVNREKVDIT